MPTGKQAVSAAAAQFKKPRDPDGRGMIALQTAAFKGAEVVRSRSPNVLKDLDVVIDVGATYAPGASLLLPG